MCWWVIDHLFVILAQFQMCNSPLTAFSTFIHKIHKMIRIATTVKTNVALNTHRLRAFQKAPQLSSYTTTCQMSVHFANF